MISRDCWRYREGVNSDDDLIPVEDFDYFHVGNGTRMILTKKAWPTICHVITRCLEKTKDQLSLEPISFVVVPVLVSDSWTECLKSSHSVPNIALNQSRA